MLVYKPTNLTFQNRRQAVKTLGRARYELEVRKGSFDFFDKETKIWVNRKNQ